MAYMDYLTYRNSDPASYRWCFLKIKILHSISWISSAIFQNSVLRKPIKHLHSDLKKQSLARISGKHKQFPYFEGASVVRQSPVVEIQLDK